MPNNEENVTSKFQVDISDLKKNMTEASRQIKLYRAELKNANAGMEKGEETADSLTKKIAAQSKIVETEQKKLQLLKDELAKYDKALKDGTKLIADLTKKHEEAAAAYGKDSEEAKKLAKQLDEAQKAQERNVKAADDLRVKIVNQDTAVKNAQGQISKFNDKLKELQTEQKKTDEATEKTTEGGLKAFTVALGNLAANVITAVINKLGEMAKSAVGAFEEFDAGRDALIKATGATGEAADELTKAYADAAKSVSGNMEDIGAAVGEVNTRFGYTGDQLSQTTEDFLRFSEITGVDAVSAVQAVSRALNSSGTDASEYTTLLDQLAVAAQASGISAETLADSLTTYGSQMRAIGFDTSDTIALLSQFESAGVNTESAVSGIRKAVVNWTKDGKNARDEFSALIDSIKKAPSDTEAAQKAVEAFGNKSGTELAEVIRSGRFEYEKFSELIADSGGTVDKTFEETQSGLDKINLAMQGVSVTMAEFAGKLIDKYAGGIETIVARFGDLLSGAEGAEQQLGDAVAGFITQVLDDAVKALPKIAALARSIVTTLAQNLIEHLPEIIDVLGTLAVDVMNDASKMLPELIDGILDALPSIIDAVLTLGEKLADALPEILTSVIAALPNLVQHIADILVTQTPKIVKSVTQIFTALVQALPQIVQGLVDALPALLTTFTNFIGECSPMLLASVLTVIDALIKAAPQIMNAIYPMIPQIADALVEGFMEFVPMFINTAGTMLGMVAGSLPELMKQIQTAASTIFQTWKTNIFDRAADAFSEIGESVKKWCSQIWEDVKGVFSGVGTFFGGIWDTIKQKFTTIGTKVGQAIGGAFKNAINSVLATVENGLNWVPDAVNGAIDLINALPGVNIGRMNRIALPRLARGGIVSKSTLANVGEAGREAIIPLDRDKAGLKEIASLILSGMNGKPKPSGTSGGGTSGRGGGTVINYTQNNNSPKALSRFEIYRQTKNMLEAVKLQEV